MKPECGIPRIIDFFNGWAEAIPELKDVLVVRYEDMRSNPRHWLEEILGFIGTPGTEAQVKEAVEFAAYDNMKKMEEKKVFWLSGARVLPGDRSNPNSYKVRRAKVGGYRDYFDDDQVAAIDALVASTLSPLFGYGDKETTKPPQGSETQEMGKTNDSGLAASV